MTALVNQVQVGLRLLVVEWGDKPSYGPNTTGFV
jgi:hypothetical protein